MDRAAFRAGTGLFVFIERLKQRRQIFHDTLEAYLDPLHKSLAIEAVPFEGVVFASGTFRFNDKTDRAFLWALRRMPHMRWQQEDIALTYRDIIEIPVVAD